MGNTSLAGRKILLGVSGSIAAYKTVFLTRLLVREGAEVRVIMTPSAAAFVSPLTFSTLSRNPTRHELMSESEWHNHVELGLWADLFVIVPATAHTLSGMAEGRCDNLLLAVYLSARCPVWVAPAMDLDMWTHPATRRNLARLAADGVRLIDVGDGELASGLSGPGRVAEPEALLEEIRHFLASAPVFGGMEVLITAGPTREALDPVRFLTNHSSGKMGVALADEMARRGALVHLVLGPAAAASGHPGVETIPVVSAAEMMEAAAAVFPRCRIAIFAAAVADYRPATTATGKIKKQGDSLSLELVKNPDIAASLGARKQKGQILAGFALETDAGEDEARKKLKAKKLDLIVLNTLQDAGAGFGTDTNKVTFLTADNKTRRFGLKSKKEVAADIADELACLVQAAP